jgi:hypothetical protein
MTNSRFEMEKFNGKRNFELWKLKMKYLLVQEVLHKALAGKRKKLLGISDDDWEYLDARGLNTIQFCLVNDVLVNIVGQGTTIGLWSRMESLYMTKSMMNRTYFKRQLYNLQLKEGTKIVYHSNLFNTLLC